MVEIVAEFTTNHFGHAGLLGRMVDAAAKAGADAVKMQKKEVATFYDSEKLSAKFESPFGKTYRDYRSLFELRSGDWMEFDSRCRVACIPWFATVQDEASLRWLVPWAELGCGLKRVKVASSNARNRPFLEAIVGQVPHDYEIVLSVAGAGAADIEAALRLLEPYPRVYLLHCVAEYPCPPEKLRLGNITELRRQFGSERVRIGYSGHEVGFQPSLAAAKLGADMVERHFCVSRHSFVHHIECSLEPPEFAAMVKAIRDRKEARDLPDAAYENGFRMTEREKAFLVDQTYGQEFLGKRSTLGEG